MRAHTQATGNLLAIVKSGNRQESELSKRVIMPRKSRENSVEEKRCMRNARNKRKRLLRAPIERETREIRRQKERDAYSRAKN